MNDTTNAPASEPTDAELEAHFSSYDVSELPSPVQVFGNPLTALPNITTIPITALPKEVREDILQKVSQAPEGKREALQDRLVREAAQAASLSFRSKVGPGYGDNATNTQRHDAEQSNRVRLLKEEADRIQAQLDEVADSKVITDPDTGEQRIELVYRSEGDNRSALIARHKAIGHEMGVLTQVEGPKARAEAIAADVKLYRDRQRLLANEAAAQEMANELENADRVKQRAEAIVSSRKTRLN